MPFERFWTFLAITFGLTWGIAAVYFAFPDAITSAFGELSMTNPLFVLAVYAPAFAAVMVVVRHSGAAGLSRFLTRLLRWRCHPAWYAFLLFGVPALMFAGWAMKGAPSPVFDAPANSMIAALAVALVLGPMEELGWRGVALPLLQQRMVPIWAGLVLGGIWALWHVPAFLASGTPQSGWSFGPYAVAVVSVSVIMTGITNASRGSLLLPALLHFQLNNPLYPDAQPYDALFFALAAAVAVGLDRTRMFSRDAAVTSVIPAAPFQTQRN